jgi:hypothetical protein
MARDSKCSGFALKSLPVPEQLEGEHGIMMDWAHSDTLHLGPADFIQLLQDLLILLN